MAITVSMAIIHMNEADVARDLHAALVTVQQGDEIVIEQNHRPVAVRFCPRHRNARDFTRIPGLQLVSL